MANRMVIGGAVLSVVLLAGAVAVKQNTTPSWWPPGTPARVLSQREALMADDKYFPCVEETTRGIMRASRFLNENPPITYERAFQAANRTCTLVVRPWVYDSK